MLKQRQSSGALQVETEAEDGSLAATNRVGAANNSQRSSVLSATSGGCFASHGLHLSVAYSTSWENICRRNSGLCHCSAARKGACFVVSLLLII